MWRHLLFRKCLLKKTLSLSAMGKGRSCCEGGCFKAWLTKVGGAIFRVTVVCFSYRYLVAVFGSQNVYYLFPFVSDTGTEPPESCIFGQMLNLGAVFSKSHADIYPFEKDVHQLFILL